MGPFKIDIHISQFQYEVKSADTDRSQQRWVSHNWSLMEHNIADITELETIGHHWG